MDDVWPPSTLLDGKYHLGALLGAGGMGSVYLATQPALERMVAIKILRSELLDDPRALAQFHHEAMATARLVHPNLVAILDVGMLADGRPFFVMEYVAGPTLGAIAAGHGTSVERACALTTQILAALAETHRAGVVHGDVKSDNVLVETTRAGTDRVKLVDFGLVTEPADGAGPPDPDDSSGTPEYMAPEVINGGAHAPAADLYGVGVILYELLTGTTPFGGGEASVIMMRHLVDPVVPPSLRRSDIEIPRALDEIVARALAKDPALRFHDADELAAALAVIEPTPTRSRWCQACGYTISRELGYCTACSAAAAWAAAGIGSQVSTAVWHRVEGRRAEVRRTHPQRAKIGAAIAQGDVGALVTGYLDLAEMLADRGDVPGAVRELQEGVDMLAAGEIVGEASSAIRRLRVALADLHVVAPPQRRHAAGRR